MTDDNKYERTLKVEPQTDNFFYKNAQFHKRNNQYVKEKYMMHNSVNIQIN